MLANPPHPLQPHSRPPFMTFGSDGISRVGCQPNIATGGPRQKIDRRNHNNMMAAAGFAAHRASIARHKHIRLIPAITNPDQYLPLPYAKSAEERNTNGKRPVDAMTTGGAVADASPSPRLVENFSRPLVGLSNRSHTAPPPTLSLPELPLPAPPTATWAVHRNELQRRSPSALGFSKPFDSPVMSPPRTPVTPPRPTRRVAYSTAADDSAVTTITSPKVDSIHEMEMQDSVQNDREPVYVLTLRTTNDIATQIQALRQRHFPASRLKVPAHITLFHALPTHALPLFLPIIASLAADSPSYGISTGRVQRLRRGVLVHMFAGETDTLRIFSELRSQFWEELTEQDRSFAPHWTVQNKQDDAVEVDRAVRETKEMGSLEGRATGLVLWRYEEDGTWSLVREWEFEGRRR